MNTEIHKNVPELRFPDFSGAWHSTPLGNNISNTGGTSLEAYMSEHGSHKVVSIGNYSTNGKYIDNGQRIEFNEKTKTKLLEQDDLVMVLNDKTSSGDIIGSAILIEEDNQYIYNQRSERIKCHANVLPQYLWHYLNSPRFRKKVFSISQGGTQIYVNFPAVKKLETIIPTIEEQQKIADFLTAVDEKITAQREKKEALTTYKKGVMQQLFSGALRFKQDDGAPYQDWEEKKLGSVCEITTGKLDANAMVDGGKYRFYTCAKDYFHINEYAFNTEALLVSGNGANVGYIHYYKGQFNAYQRTYVLDKFSENIFYIQHFLNKFLHERIQKEKNEGNTPYIVLSTLKDMLIKTPVIDEQQKIANFLSGIDEKIEAVDAALSQAQAFKKGLLQKMFV